MNGDNLPYELPSKDTVDPDILGYEINTNGSVTLYRKGNEQNTTPIDALPEEIRDVALFLQKGFGKK